MILAGIAIEFIVGNDAPSAEDALGGTPIPDNEDFGSLTLAVPENGGTEGRENANLVNYEAVLRVAGFPDSIGMTNVLVSGTYEGPGSLLFLTS